MSAQEWDEAIEEYYREHPRLLTDADARGPDLLRVEKDPTGGVWRVVQTLHDPEGHHDWVIEGVVDLAACDEEGAAVVRVERMHRLGG